jgi:hypothetical protein
MSIALYKPNSKNTGTAVNLRIGSGKYNVPALYIGAIQQHSWDDSRKLGSFSENAKNPDKTINIKLNEFECGEILNSIKDRVEYSTFHKFDDNQTVIKFTPWDKQRKISKYNPKSKTFDETSVTVSAFGLTITRNGNQSFKISIEPGEVRVIEEFLKNYLIDFFKSKAENLDKNKSSATPTENLSEDPPF